MNIGCIRTRLQASGRRIDADFDHSLQERRKLTRRLDDINTESKEAQRRINLKGLGFVICYGYGSLHPTSL